MAKGNSGRIVIEIEPELKQELYSVLGNEHMNLKQWFLGNVEEFLRNKTQLPLELNVESDFTEEFNPQ
jgi:hypothetical protein